MLQQIPEAMVEPAWMLAEPLLKKVVPHAMGYWGIDELHQDVSTGRRNLLLEVTGVEITAALVVAYQKQLDHVSAWVSALGGDGCVNGRSIEDLASLLKSNGATHIEAAMRPSVVRLLNQHGLGFKEKYRVYEAMI